MNEHSTNLDQSAPLEPHSPTEDTHLWRPEPESAASDSSRLATLVTRAEEGEWHPEDEKTTQPEEIAPPALLAHEPSPHRESPYTNFGAGEDGEDDPTVDAALSAALDAALRVIGVSGEESEIKTAQEAVSELDPAVVAATSEAQVAHGEQPTAVTETDEAIGAEQALGIDAFEHIIKEIADDLRDAREPHLDEVMKGIHDRLIQAIVRSDHRETAYTAELKLKRMELWEGSAEREKMADRSAMDDALESVGVHYSERTNPKVPFNRAVARVMGVMGNDIHGTSDHITYDKPQNVAGMNPYFYYESRQGYLLAALGRGEVNSPETVATAEKVFEALVHFGLYKYHKWETASVLTTVFSWMEQFTRRLPDFSPERAGMDAAYNSLVQDQAIIALDQRHHPNHEFLQNKINLRRGAAVALHSLDRVTAVMALRDQQAPIDSEATN